MAEINYPQRWLKDLKAKTSTLGWFKDLGFEVLKTQKSLEYDPIDVTDCFIVIPENVNCLDVIPIDFKFLPRVATELNYTINTSDTTICVFDEENNSLVFLNKPGSVTITVEMATGSATFEKTINVLKNADVATIEEGNTFVKDTISPLTIKLLPNDTTEKVIDVTVWNTNDITITKLVSEIDENNKYEVISSNVGSYDLKINTNVRSYKVPIYFVETPGLVVENISFQEKDYYQFNETIYILPELLPDTARFKSYNVLVDDQNIAVWNSGKNAIITKNINGVTSATIKMNQGLAEYKFDINVKDDSTIVPITDINITNLPQSITKGQKMELELNITPSNGTIDDLVITSTPEAIIKKENGKWFVTGASIGTATITAESARSNFSKNFTLEILTNIVLVSEISTTTISDTLLLGESETFTVSVLPVNATNKTYTVTTSENISFVDDTNNNYTITSTSLGDGWVKIVANDASGIELTKNITVNPVLVSGFTTTTIPTTTIIGNEIEFDVTPTPANATNKNYTVTATGFTITDKGNGKYGAVSNAVGEGNIKITASDAGGYVLTKNITVNPVLVSSVTLSTIPDTLLTGGNTTFTVSVLPVNATNKTYTVTTSENISFVDNGSDSFTATANTAGAGWIKATANDASAVSTTKNITINNPVVLVSGLTFDIPETILQTDTLDTSTVVVAPADATNKTYTVAVVSGPATINGNTVSFSDVGEVNISITANDASGISINKIFEVTTA